MVGQLIVHERYVLLCVPQVPSVASVTVRGCTCRKEVHVPVHADTKTQEARATRWVEKQEEARVGETKNQAVLTTDVDNAGRPRQGSLSLSHRLRAHCFRPASARVDRQTDRQTDHVEAGTAESQFCNWSCSCSCSCRVFVLWTRG